MTGIQPNQQTQTLTVKNAGPGNGRQLETKNRDLQSM